MYFQLYIFYRPTFFDLYLILSRVCYETVDYMWTDVSPPSRQPEADPFADFLSATPSAASQTATPASSEIFASAPASTAAQTKTSTKDAIMALYGNATTAPAPGPYCMPSAGVCTLCTVHADAVNSNFANLIGD